MIFKIVRKIRRLIFLFLLVLLVGLAVPKLVRAVDGYWAYWWPPKATPWIYDNQIGGVSFSTYTSQTNFSQLEAEFRRLVEYSKPDYLVVFVDLKIVQPLKQAAENNRNLSEIRSNEFDFSYYDDLVKMAKANNIKIIFYPELSAYGGQAMYPFSYYSKIGWFWKRPNWEKGYANPTTDAARYPNGSQINSDYNWIEHEGSYEHVAQDGARHFSITSDGVENTGIGDWQVYESPDMVFNGADTMLHDGTLHVHSPLPSLSSEGYRNFLRQTYEKFAVHYKDDSTVWGFYVWQEPTYNHLRENISYSNGFSGNTDAGDSRQYETDYSKVELDRYNNWRVSKGMATVANVPYPPDNTYKQFREWNLADFQKNLADGVKSVAPNMKILMSIFIYEPIVGMANNPTTLMSVVKPDWITIERPDSIEPYLSGNNWTNFYNSLKNSNPNLKGVLSHWIGQIDKDNKSREIGDEVMVPIFNGGGVSNYDSMIGDINGYAHWPSGGCQLVTNNCVIRYSRSASYIPVSECTLVEESTGVTDLIRWYVSYRSGSADGDLNCDGNVNVTDLIFWYGKYRD